MIKTETILEELIVKGEHFNKHEDYTGHTDDQGNRFDENGNLVN